MSDPAVRAPTHQDLFDLPEHVVGEILGGEIHVTPRPRAAHAVASAALGGEVGPPFGYGKGGPGGWWILVEPEIHLGENILVPDLAGWRRERVPDLLEMVAIPVAPDWVCEILSPATQVRDRTLKMSIYAREGVPHLWLVDPQARLLEVYRLHEGHWLLLGVYEGKAKVRAEPFDAVELALGPIWGEVEAPPKEG